MTKTKTKTMTRKIRYMPPPIDTKTYFGAQNKDRP